MWSQQDGAVLLAALGCQCISSTEKRGRQDEFLPNPEAPIDTQLFPPDQPPGKGQSSGAPAYDAFEAGQNAAYKAAI